MSKAEEKKFKAPKGFTSQSLDAVGYWDDDGESDIRFVPRGVKLLDGSAKTDKSKPSCLIIGELKAPATMVTKDDSFTAEAGDVVGVYYKPGMGKALVHAVGIETWIAPLFDEDGNRKEIATGKANKMKAYDVRFAGKISTDKRLPVLEDARKESRYAKTAFDDPSLRPLRKRPETAPEAPTETGDVDDSDIPF